MSRPQLPLRPVTGNNRHSGTSAANDDIYTLDGNA